MRGIADTIARLAASAQGSGAGANSGRLEAVDGFGSNPGNLKAFVHIPKGLAPNAPLVVVLHGCTQSAAGYDETSGWSELADEQGFAVLYPEQQRSNNANGCFNWFEPADTQRGSGEVLSIRQMIATVVTRHAIDPTRVFVTGLSAGGAMTASMLATYPEVFAGGAIIAGLPHGAASGMVQAFDRMRGHGLPTADGLEAAVRAASAHPGPWPSLSIWHGTADRTVNVVNAEAIGTQWRGLHGLPDNPSELGQVDGVPHRIWYGSDGRALVEDYLVPGMGHGTPLDTRGPSSLGSSAPYMLDVGINSTRRIAAFWNITGMKVMPLTKSDVEAASDDQALHKNGAPSVQSARRIFGTPIKPKVSDRSPTYITKVIEDAMRSAGLMK
jgi:poly(hydroxyalkanoate) depolymerase family esterase